MQRQMLFRLVCTAAVLWIAIGAAVAAQSATATLTGTISDETGGVVSGVTVSVLNAATLQQRTTKTSTEGGFAIPLLPPGRYTLTAVRDGFTPIEVRDLVLNVGSQLSLQLQLKVASIGEAVSVVAEPSRVNTSPAVSTVVDRQFVENLPLNGRSFQQLITIAPGVVLTKATSQDQGQFSVNGQRANANYFTVDGVSANIGVSVGINVLSQNASGSLPGMTAFGGTNNLVSVDALQEFRIQTSSYAAEFGRQPGAQVQIVTRAGTNDVHGSLSEYFRHDALDANDWFNNARGLPKPETRQHDLGGVLGGPLVKGRTFYFASYEGLRLKVPRSVGADVPSMAARQAAPASVRPLLNAYPQPNGGDRIGADGLPNGFALFNASFSNPSSLDATSLRVDHAVRPQLTIFGRYNYAPSDTTERGFGGSNTLNTLTTYETTTQTLTIGVTHLVTSTISHEARLNVSRNTSTSSSLLDDFGGATVPEPSLLFPPGTSAADSTSSIFITGPAGTILNVGTLSANVQRQLNVVDNWMAVKGRHQLKAGVDYRRVYPIVAPQAYSALVQFNGVGTPGGALPAGSALTGVSAGAVITASSGNRYPVFQNLSLFAQDTWKPSSRLTLTYGLRWELNPPPSESRGNDAYTVLGLDDPATATLAPRGTALYDTTYKNVAPRIGAAYQLSERSGREVVLRGGVGVFYDLGYGAIANAFGGAYPFTARKTVFNVAVPLGGADAESPAITPGPSGELTVFESGIKMPRVYQWNVSAEQALGHMQSVTVAYIGAAGRELLRKDRLYGTAFGGVLNPAVFHPQMQLQVTRNTATSDYKALQVQYQRRLSRGLQAMASYTLAESLDIASNDSFDVTAQAAAIDPKTDRGPSEFDVRHALNTAISYDLPSPAGLAAPILGGWSIDGIITARSATPVNVVYSRVIPGFGTITARPDLVPDIPLVLDDPTAPGGRRFNNTPAIVPGNPLPQIGPFLRPVQARQGSLSRNALRGFPMWQVDLALRRRVRLAGRTNLQFRAEFFNALNHPNFADPVGTLIASTFGSSTAMLGRSLGSGSAVGGFNPLYQVGGPRSIQLSAKIAF